MNSQRLNSKFYSTNKKSPGSVFELYHGKTFRPIVSGRRLLQGQRGYHEGD
jgi:hypothetical protein